jgi:hypothetical protein
LCFYDASRHELVVFGGAAGSGGTLFGDTAMLGSSGWTVASPSGPAARTDGAAAFVAHRGVGLIYGGSGSGTSVVADPWTWDGVAWAPLTAANPPPARVAHGMAYDSLRDVVVLFGGATPSGAVFSYVGETWELTYRAAGLWSSRAGGEGRPPDMVAVPLAEAISRMKAVPLECDTILTARDLGVCLGD